MLMNRTVRLFFAGDFCSKPSTSMLSVSDELKALIQSCDLRIVNFEVPLKPDVQLPPNRRERFFQSDDAPAFLRMLGFNLFSLANNHAFDWGDAGYLKTKSVLGDDSFGAGTYDEAYEIKVVDVNGVRIGLMALSFAAYEGVFNDVTNQKGLGCAYINDLKVNHIIISEKQHLDYLFILPHDGIEYIDIPLPETIARYHDFIDYGADGVIATHPHCPQGWEEYKGKPIFYSLGNFLFNSKVDYSFRSDLPHWYEGMCIVLTLENGNISWDVVNTRNVDNVRIEVDGGETRDAHNECLCRYLANAEEYNQYFERICRNIGYNKFMKMIDCTFHPFSLKKSTSVLIKRWKEYFKRVDFTDDAAIERILAHDGNRSFLLHSIKMRRNK